METEIKTEGDVDTSNNEGEGQGTEQPETIAISKSEYDKLNQTLGSLKRELKDVKKAKEEPKETPKSNQTDASPLVEKLEKMALRQAGITHADDIELVRATAKKWNMDVDDVLLDEDFKIKLERQQTNRANLEATSGVKGGAGANQAKLSAEYWLAKGKPPTPSDVPDRKTRAQIIRTMMKNSGNNKKFYND